MIGIVVRGIVVVRFMTAALDFKMVMMMIMKLRATDFIVLIPSASSDSQSVN
jgi:hypothetical protein